MAVALVNMTLSIVLWMLLETPVILGMLALFTVVWMSKIQPFATCNVRVELRSSSRGMMLCERRILLCRLRTAAAKVAAYSASSCFWCRISCVLTVRGCVDLCMMSCHEYNEITEKKLRSGGPNPVPIIEDTADLGASSVAIAP